LYNIRNLKNKREAKMTFGTAIQCIDGRIQEPIIKFLKSRYNLTYIDTITEPGVCKILAERSSGQVILLIEKALDISVNLHKSRMIAVSGHHDCASNPSDENTQKKQVNECKEYLKAKYPGCEILGLWVDKNWKVNII
jgi:hypothetical protein